MKILTDTYCLSSAEGIKVLLGEHVNGKTSVTRSKRIQDSIISYVASTRREKSRVNTRELMSFTRGLLIVRMPQASLAMFAMTSCIQCTIRSPVLKAPTHLRKSLESVGFIATPRCAKPVKLSTKCFQEILRDFSVRLLAIAF